MLHEKIQRIYSIFHRVVAIQVLKNIVYERKKNLQTYAFQALSYYFMSREYIYRFRGFYQEVK